MKYIYLHGFASSPNSTKALEFRDRFAKLNISLEVPDLNQGDFTSLTLTRQIEQVEKILPEEAVTIIGSSFGGLTAAWLGQRCSQLERLILLAPAFGFLSHWLPTLGESNLRQWQLTGFLSVYHYGEKQMLPLSYNFIKDMVNYSESDLIKPVPTLIFHGINDETIPVEASQNYAINRPWVKLRELESDHGLTDAIALIWDELIQLCSIEQVFF